jgi:hypothetical protein
MPKISIETAKKKNYIGSFIFWIALNLITEYIVQLGIKMIPVFTEYIILETQTETINRNLTSNFLMVYIAVLYIILISVKLLPLLLNWNILYKRSLSLLIPITLCIYLAIGPFVFKSAGVLDLNWYQLFYLFASACLFSSFNRHKLMIKA